MRIKRIDYTGLHCRIPLWLRDNIGSCREAWQALDWFGFIQVCYSGYEKKIT
jgi:hypothetical protein